MNNENIYVNQRTSVGDRDAKQHDRVGGASLTSCLYRTFDRCDNHVKHQATQDDSGQLVFPSGPIYSKSKRDTENSQETYAEGLFPIEKRKQATTIKDIINCK